MEEIPRPLNDWAKTYEGKPGISVRQHLLAVACVAETLLRRYPHFCEQFGFLPQAILFLVASHDVGKLSLDFLQGSRAWLEMQSLVQAAERGGWASVYTRKHPEISCESLQLFLADKLHASRKTAACWGAVVGAHHGRLKEPRLAPLKPLDANHYTRVLEGDRQACLQELWEHFGKPELPNILDKNAPVLWCTAGLVTLADWIGSDETFFPPDKELEEEILRKQAEKAVDAIGLGLPPVTPGLTFGEIFNGRTAYPLQEQAAAVIGGPGIYIIEAPMGMGKTEAALWASYALLARGKANGIFFALPTQATTNRMFLRFADYVHHICPQAAPVQLIHGNSWLQEDLKGLVCPASPEENADPCWFNTTRRSLFAPFGVGTVDQALLAVLPAKYFTLRRFALAGKIVVIDEVHAYDAYTGTLIRHLCQELEQLGCTVIILSATLTEQARCSLLSLPPSEEQAEAPYPRISGRAGKTLLPEYETLSVPDKTVAVEHLEREAALARALELAGRGAQVLWVCNTVARAQETFMLLKQQAAALPQAPNMGLLHSRFPFYRRESLEQEWMTRLGPQGKRERGAILVSTQIVEQSVDVDADALFSELAPTDMLLQRLGRLWRHPRGQRPLREPLFCLLKDAASCEELKTMDAAAIKQSLGEKAFVYSPYVLLRSLELWEPLTQAVLPSGIRGLMTATYAEKDVPSGWEELLLEDDGKRMAEESLANMSTNLWAPALDDRSCLKTRLGEEEAVMLLCTAQEGKRFFLLDGSELVLPSGGKLSFDAAKKLHRHTVRLPCSCMAAKPLDPLLMPYHINGCLLIGKGDILLPYLRPGRSLHWDEDLGIVIRKE